MTTILPGTFVKPCYNTIEWWETLEDQQRDWQRCEQCRSHVCKVKKLAWFVVAVLVGDRYGPAVLIAPSGRLVVTHPYYFEPL